MPTQGAFEGHGFAGRAAQLAATTTPQSPTPATHLGEGPSPSSELFPTASSAFLLLRQRGGAKGGARLNLPKGGHRREQ